jgi:putative endonuclease
MVGLQVFLPAGRQGSWLNMFHVYILKSHKDENWSYVGSTDNIQRRFNEHRLGKVRSTKGKRPLHLVHEENFQTRDEALTREKYLKSGFGREEKRNIINCSGIV